MPAPRNRFGPPEAYGKPPSSGRFWLDFVGAAAAIFISVISLLVAFRGEETQRGLLAANSWPFLQLSKDRSTDEDRLDVENEGVGPAKIYSFEVFYKGQPVDSALDLLTRCCDVAAPHESAFSGVGYGSLYGNVLRPGEHIVALGIRKSHAPATNFDRFTDALPDLTFRACYCSVLNECWISDLLNISQQPVRTCPVGPKQFVLGERPRMPTAAK